MDLQTQTGFLAPIQSVLHGRPGGGGNDLCDNRRRDVVNVAVVKRQGVGVPRLVGRIDQIELQQPEAEGFDAVAAGEDFHAISRPVLVAIIDQDTLLDNHLFPRIASVQNAECVVRKTPSKTKGTEGAEIGIAGLPVQHQDAESDSAVVLDPVVQQWQVERRRNQRNTIGGAMSDVDLLNGRRTMDGQYGGASFTVKNSGASDVYVIEPGMALQVGIQMNGQS